MTNAIEVTKREMYNRLANLKSVVSPSHLSMGLFEIDLESHLEALRQEMLAMNDRSVKLAQSSADVVIAQETRLSAMTTERDTLRNRVQVLEMANATSGEVIRGLKEEARQARKNFMAARLAEVAASVSVPPYNASGETLDANTATILGALVDAQRIMTDYLVPDGIRAKDAMGKIIPVLDNEKLNLAMDAFEKPKAKMTAAAAAQYAGIMNRQYSPSNGEACMHSFHQCYGPRETCTFCGVGK